MRGKSLRLLGIIEMFGSNGKLALRMVRAQRELSVRRGQARSARQRRLRRRHSPRDSLRSSPPPTAPARLASLAPHAAFGGDPLPRLAPLASPFGAPFFLYFSRFALETIVSIFLAA